MATATVNGSVGKVVQVIGPVIDVEFPEAVPEIYNALEIIAKGEEGQPDINVTAEVQQHIGRSQVRAVAMSTTDGVVRGMEVRDTGSAISVPVGDAALGRILNVLENRSISRVTSPPMSSAGRFTGPHRSSRRSSQRRRSSKPASRSST